MHRRYSPDQVEAYFYGEPASIGDRILFIKRENRLDEYRKHLDGVCSFGHVWHGINGTFGGESVSIVVAGVGPGLIGDAVYALNRPQAICLYSGTCGGLWGYLEVGDYVVAEQAVCGDGYSLQLGYAPLSMAAGDPDLLASLAASLAARVDRAHSGITFTTSSVVREAEPDFWHTVNARCCAIEMGAAAFYAAARATRKRAAAYFWVTDLPSGGKSFFDPSTEQDVQIKQSRYDRSILMDLALLTSL